LENSAKNNYAEFSTVTTAPTAIYLKEERRKQRQGEKVRPDCYGQERTRSVKNHLVPATIYMAGFDPDHVWPVLG